MLTKVKNAPDGWFEWCYIVFNWLEALGWIAFAIYVWRRAWKGKSSRVEFYYGLAFLVFGVTDVIEVYQLTLGLFAAKVLIFVSLLILRQKVVALHLPRKLYL